MFCLLELMFVLETNSGKVACKGSDTLAFRILTALIGVKYVFPGESKCTRFTYPDENFHAKAFEPLRPSPVK